MIISIMTGCCYWKKQEMLMEGQRLEAGDRYDIAFIILKNGIVFIIPILLVLFAGLREIGFDRDSLNYANVIQSIDYSNFFNSDFSDKEISFYLISFINHWLFVDPVRSTFITYALIGVILKIIGIYKLSRIPLLSVILYICYFYPIHELTMIRVGVASAIFLYAIPDLVNNNYKSYLIKVIFAALFHYSAIITILLYFIRDKNVSKIFIILPILAFISSIVLNKFIIDYISINLHILNILPSFLNHKIFFYIDLLQKGIFIKFNYFSPFYLSLVLIYYFCLINITRFKSHLDIILIKILGLGLSTYYFLSFLPVLAYRLSEIFNIVILILFPSIIYIFKRDNRLIIMFLIFIYSLLSLVNIIFIQKWFDLGVL